MMVINRMMITLKINRTIKRCAFALFALLTSSSALASDVLVEAESFQNKGGWSVDQQFIDQMGSPYLIAHGLGKKVNDAQTNIEIKDKAKYYVYVRTYNWTAPWCKTAGPGKFLISINNKKLNATLGSTGDKWMWQYAGEVSLPAGKASLKLHDLTGFDGRCDAIFLTTTPTTPPNSLKELCGFRVKHNPTLQKEPAKKQFDLVVVGGGVAGMSAALSAARLGMKVALIQDRPVLGGNNSSEVRVHLGGKIEIGPFPRLGGLQKEFGPTLEGNAMPAHHYADEKKLEMIKAEKNIELFLNYRAIQAESKGNKIQSVLAQNTETAQQISFSAPLFVDCTGDGTIGYLVGADYMMGRESKDDFYETLAPNKADSLVMGSSVQWYSVKQPKPTTFPLFNYGITFTEATAEKIFRGEWTWETGMNKNQINDFEQIRDYGMLVAYSNWSYVKNQSVDRKKFANYKLEWVAYVAGKRESRRLLGDYILSEHDLSKVVDHEDASFPTSWSIDLHYPDSVNSIHFPGNEFKAITKQMVLYPHTVPYRCLYSRNIDNLFMAGRNISVTHVALGAIRVMRTTGMMGEVVGMAASLCKQFNTTPRGVYQYHLKDLKELMKKGVGNPNLPNNQKYNEGWNLEKKPVVK
jgi:putative pyridine nucleotide-disulfide oxidoreductase